MVLLPLFFLLITFCATGWLFLVCLYHYVWPHTRFYYDLKGKTCESVYWSNDVDQYFLFCSKDIQFGIKFKAKPHSGWKDNENEIEEIWVEELEPITECDASVTG